jgi:hypothetical protein
MVHLIVPQPLSNVAEARVAALGLESRLICYPDLTQEVALGAGTYLFTSASALSAPQRALAIVAEEALGAGGPGFRLMNRPSLVPGRRLLMDAFEAEGFPVVERRAASAMPASVKYPLVLRWESAHGIAESPVLSDEAELREAVGTMVLGGFALADQYGLHMPALDTLLERSPAAWALKIGDAAVMSSSLESGKPGELAKSFLSSKALSSVDFVMLSFLLADGRPVLWRIDDSPTALPDQASCPPAAWPRIRDKVHAAFQALDAGSGDGEAFIRFTRESVRAALKA